MKNPEKENSIEIPDVNSLNVLYTNDICGEAEQMPYLATVAKQIRASEPYTVLLDSGNWARGTFLSDKFKGMPMVEIFSALDYDAIGIGEGEIHFGSKNLYLLEEKASFPFVSCNLEEEETEITPYFIKKYVLLEKGPFKIAVTGVAAPDKYAGSGFRVKDPFTILPQILKEIEQSAPDVTMLLSRMGIERDRALARAFPQFNVIIGGGDGKFLEKPIVEGRTFICQAGERAKFLGSLKIDMESIIRITPAK
jgi:5'-nucleotidase